ncbi:MAG TPA: hypothetical protein VH307_28345, partial [Streptosporangiaceae bacterium]|nr:hypothetical protein [Streptosporangiaceae bacterium]
MAVAAGPASPDAGESEYSRLPAGIESPRAAGPESPWIAPQSGLRLLRSRGRTRGVVALLGPAFVAAVAYVDPG